MPIPEELKPFLEGIPAEQVSIFDNLLTKTPDLSTRLKEGVLRQSDYDRKMNANKVELEKAQKYAKDWEEWQIANKPIHEKALEDYAALEKQQRDLQERLRLAEAARASSGGDEVNAAELELKVREQVEKLGYVSKTEMDSIIATETAKQAQAKATELIGEATKEFWSKTFPAAAAAQADIAEICYDYKAEFGENIDRAALDTIMKERNLSDFKKGFEILVEPKRTAKKYAEDVKKEAQILASGMVGGGMAGGPNGGPAPMGAIQMDRQRRAEIAAAQTGGNNSTTIAAMEAAKQLRAEGKF